MAFTLDGSKTTQSRQQMFKIIIGTNANTALRLRTNRSQTGGHRPGHIGKRGIADLLTSVSISDLNTDSIWP